MAAPPVWGLINTPRLSCRGWGLPERLGGHVGRRDAVIHQRLVPHGVQCVLQRFGAELVGLWWDGGGDQDQTGIQWWWGAGGGY